MAAPLFFNLTEMDLTTEVYSRQAIYARLQQRFEFEQLHGIVYLDHQAGEAIAYRDVGEDEWWCRGHVPGSPIFPGVLMLESAAQIAAFMEKYSDPEFAGFVGFGGVDNCKFRQTVRPPARLWLLCRRLEARSRRIVCGVQGVIDGVLAFEATVTGLVVPL